MFSSFRDSVYFAKVSGLCIKSFGVDLMQISRTMDGQLLAITSRCRREKLGPEDAATQCISAGLRFLVDNVEIPDGNSPNHSQLARWSTIVDGWTAQGLVSHLSREKFSETISHVLRSAG
jgi:hypothetical protein